VSEEIEAIGPLVDEAIIRRLPDALAQYEELKEELRRLLTQERKAYQRGAR
jgi:hypothetical protein